MCSQYVAPSPPRSLQRDLQSIYFGDILVTLTVPVLRCSLASAIVPMICVEAASG
jgi:hypothetical protein